MLLAHIFTFDPTTEPQTWLVANAAGEQLEELAWPARMDGEPTGESLIRALQKWQPTSADTLQIVRGPGGYGAVRTAALVANATAWQTGCVLATRLISETEWQLVPSIQPFYAAPPAITPARKS